MIIVCPECSTKFNIAAERIPAKGAKVRCARCQHVFAVESAAEAPAAPEATGIDQPQESHQLEQEETTPEESDFSYDRFQELDGKGDKEEFNFAAEASRWGSLPDQPGDSETTDPADGDLGPIEKIYGDAASKSDRDTITEEREDIFAATEEELPQAEPPFSPPVKPKRGPVASIIRILLLLIIGLLILAGVMIYMNGTDQFNRTLQQLFGQQKLEQTAPGQITLTGLEGRFIQNEQAGELFLIEGQAVNNYKEPRAAIQVKGIIYDQTGQALLQKTVFCGNPISEEDLKALPFAELETFMGNQFGKKLSNMKVAPKQQIPFIIVFRDLPANLAEFSVKIADSKPATN